MTILPALTRTDGGSSPSSSSSVSALQSLPLAGASAEATRVYFAGGERAARLDSLVELLVPDGHAFPGSLGAGGGRGIAGAGDCARGFRSGPDVDDHSFCACCRWSSEAVFSTRKILWEGIVIRRKSSASIHQAYGFFFKSGTWGFVLLLFRGRKDMLIDDPGGTGPDASSI